MNKMWHTYCKCLHKDDDDASQEAIEKGKMTTKTKSLEEQLQAPEMTRKKGEGIRRVYKLVRPANRTLLLWIRVDPYCFSVQKHRSFNSNGRNALP